MMQKIKGTNYVKSFKISAKILLILMSKVKLFFVNAHEIFFSIFANLYTNFNSLFPSANNSIVMVEVSSGSRFSIFSDHSIKHQFPEYK